VSGAARATGRFAPSPTGPLHFGSLVAALASAVDARASGARWLVRVEDVDEPRAIPGAERDILATLARYGFAHDGDIVRQSDRAATYARALETLDAKGWLYACACTRRDLESAPLSSAGERVYPGTCRRGIPPDRAANPQRALRVRVGAEPIAFVDRLQGAQRQDSCARSATSSCAARTGSRRTSSRSSSTTPRRASRASCAAPTCSRRRRARSTCSSALGLTTPSYLHVPVAIDASGEKLSKQTRAQRCPTIRCLRSPTRGASSTSRRSRRPRSPSSGRARSPRGRPRGCRR
jgi:glutamyl-Q tRNA(Asp) synthetase